MTGQSMDAGPEPGGHGLVAARPAVVGTAHASLNDIKYPDNGGD